MQCSIQEMQANLSTPTSPATHTYKHKNTCTQTSVRSRTKITSTEAKHTCRASENWFSELWRNLRLIRLLTDCTVGMLNAVVGLLGLSVNSSGCWLLAAGAVEVINQNHFLSDFHLESSACRYAVVWVYMWLCVWVCVWLYFRSCFVKYLILSALVQAKNL